MSSLQKCRSWGLRWWAIPRQFAEDPLTDEAPIAIRRDTDSSTPTPNSKARQEAGAEGSGGEDSHSRAVEGEVGKRHAVCFHFPLMRGSRDILETNTHTIADHS